MTIHKLLHSLLPRGDAWNDRSGPLSGCLSVLANEFQTIFDKISDLKEIINPKNKESPFFRSSLLRSVPPGLSPESILGELRDNGYHSIEFNLKVESPYRIAPQIKVYYFQFTVNDPTLSEEAKARLVDLIHQITPTYIEAEVIFPSQ